MVSHIKEACLQYFLDLKSSEGHILCGSIQCDIVCFFFSSNLSHILEWAL